MLSLTGCSTSPPVVETKVVTVKVPDPQPVPASMTTPRAKPPPSLQHGATWFDLSHNNLLWQQAYATLWAQLEEIAGWSAKAKAQSQTSGKPKQ